VKKSKIDLSLETLATLIFTILLSIAKQEAFQFYRNFEFWNIRVQIIIIIIIYYYYPIYPNDLED